MFTALHCLESLKPPIDFLTTSKLLTIPFRLKGHTQHSHDYVSDGSNVIGAFNLFAIRAAVPNRHIIEIRNDLVSLFALRAPGRRHCREVEFGCHLRAVPGYGSSLCLART